MSNSRTLTDDTEIANGYMGIDVGSGHYQGSQPNRHARLNTSIRMNKCHPIQIMTLRNLPARFITLNSKEKVRIPISKIFNFGRRANHLIFAETLFGIIICEENNFVASFLCYVSGSFAVSISANNHNTARDRFVIAAFDPTE